MTRGVRSAQSEDEVRRLREWLMTCEGHLPRAGDLAALLHMPDAYAVCGAFNRLQRSGVIRQRTGTRSENRGHRVVQVMQTGRVLKTADCPFDLA